MSCIGTQITNYQSKALVTDSGFPPLKPGHLRLYGSRFSSFVHRVLLVLSAKDIPCEVVNIHLIQKPVWYKEKNPLEKVPCLEIDGQLIYESLICSEWLDEMYPVFKIIRGTPTEIAEQKMLVERFSRMHPVMFQWTSKPDDPVAIQEVNKLIQICESLLKDNYYGGSEPGWADLMSWPFFERFQAVVDAGSATFDHGIGKLPKLTAYIKRMLSREDVSRVSPPLDLYPEFIKKYLAKQPDFDIGLH